MDMINSSDPVYCAQIAENSMKEYPLAPKRFFTINPVPGYNECWIKINRRGPLIPDPYRRTYYIE